MPVEWTLNECLNQVLRRFYTLKNQIKKVTSISLPCIHIRKSKQKWIFFTRATLSGVSTLFSCLFCAETKGVFSHFVMCTDAFFPSSVCLLQKEFCALLSTISAFSLSPSSIGYFSCSFSSALSANSTSNKGKKMKRERGRK